MLYYHAIEIVFFSLFGFSVGVYASFKLQAIGFRRSVKLRKKVLSLYHSEFPEDYHSICGGEPFEPDYDEQTLS